MEALYANSYRKIKSRKKSPWVKKTKQKKNGPKTKERAPFCEGKKTNLAESDKGSWFGQTPSKISGSAENPKRSNILGESSLKIILHPLHSARSNTSSNFDLLFRGVHLRNSS